MKRLAARPAPRRCSWPRPAAADKIVAKSKTEAEAARFQAVLEQALLALARRGKLCPGSRKQVGRGRRDPGADAAGGCRV